MAGEKDPHPPSVTHVPGRELPDEAVVVVQPRRVPLPLRVGYLLVGIAVFVTALGVMRAGAEALVPSLTGSAFTDSAWSALGLGWLGACLVLSGSPVAASAITLLDGGAIDGEQAFAMLTGSRLGAAFVVLVVGVAYAARPTTRAKRAPISIGILALLMTALVYVPAGVAGFLMLERGVLDGWTMGAAGELTSATDALLGGIVDAIVTRVPSWTLFPLGLALLLVGFRLFDRVLPAVGSAELEGHREGWYSGKWSMFLLGAAVTLLTLSVAVSLTLLVPLVARGTLRRANTLPYIAGANITTLVDTLVAAILLADPEGIRIVVLLGMAVTVWTLVLLLLAYPLVRRACLGVTRRALESKPRLAAFLAATLMIPVVLIVV